MIGQASQALDVAQTFAQALLCTKPNEGSACGLCKSCLLISAQTHPDYLVLTTTGIDVIRSVIDFCEQTPQCGDKKIIIIPNTHQMNISASNALLKTLEEPPGNSYFLLLTDVPAALPATLRSRCQLIRLPLSMPIVMPWQEALHADCAALLSKKLDPLMMAQKWQKEDLLSLLAQMEIYFVKIKSFIASQISNNRTT